MFVTQAMISQMEEKYGLPREARLVFEMRAEEFSQLKSSMKHGRAHDVTLFISHGDRIAVIRKPAYPPGIFRAPSGGIHPGEGFEEGALREAYEETGLRIQLLKYLMRVFISFTHKGEEVDWTTHVFTAEAKSEEICPVDTHEIAEAFWVSREELRASSQGLRTTGSTGLLYRATLNDMMMEWIDPR